MPTHHCILIPLLPQSIVLMALCTVGCASFSRTAFFKRRHSFVRLPQLPRELCCRAVLVHHCVGGSAPSAGRVAGIFFLNPARISLIRAAAGVWRRYFIGEESGRNDLCSDQSCLQCPSATVYIHCTINIKTCVRVLNAHITSCVNKTVV